MSNLTPPRPHRAWWMPLWWYRRIYLKWAWQYNRVYIPFDPAAYIAEQRAQMEENIADE